MNLSVAVFTFVASMKGVKSKATIRWYEHRLSSLKNFIGGDTSIEEINIHNLRNWRANLSDRQQRYEKHPNRNSLPGGLSRDTLHGYVRAARRFFGWLTEEELLKKNPAKRLEYPSTAKRPKSGVSDRDRAVMIEYAKRNIRDYAILLFAADTGCRASGIAGLRWSDLDIDRGRAIVYEKGRGGNNKGRSVYFLAETAMALRQLRSTMKKNDVYVFQSEKKEGIGGLTISGIYRIFARIAQRSGVRGKCSPHQWRHWRARKWAERGMNLGVIAQLLGHTDVKVTSDYYGTFADADLQKAHQKYSIGDTL